MKGQTRTRKRDSNSWIIPRGMLIKISILREAAGNNIQEEADVGLPHKPVPIRAVPGEVSLEITPGNPQLATCLHLQKMSPRADPGENSG